MESRFLSARQPKYSYLVSTNWRAVSLYIKIFPPGKVPTLQLWGDIYIAPPCNCEYLPNYCYLKSLDENSFDPYIISKRNKNICMSVLKHVLVDYIGLKRAGWRQRSRLFPKKCGNRNFGRQGSSKYQQRSLWAEVSSSVRARNSVSRLLHRHLLYRRLHTTLPVG